MLSLLINVCVRRFLFTPCMRWCDEVRLTLQNEPKAAPVNLLPCKIHDFSNLREVVVIIKRLHHMLHI